MQEAGRPARASPKSSSNALENRRANKVTARVSAPVVAVVRNKISPRSRFRQRLLRDGALLGEDATLELPLE